MSKGSKRPPNAGKGRKKGVPNKSTADVRAAIAIFAQNNVGALEIWVKRTARRSPAKAAELFLRAIEYHIPKVSKLELTGANGGPIKHDGTIDAQLTADAAMRKYLEIMGG